MIYYEKYYIDDQNYFFLPQTPGRGHILRVQKSEQPVHTFLENFGLLVSQRNSNKRYKNTEACGKQSKLWMPLFKVICYLLCCLEQYSRGFFFCVCVFTFDLDFSAILWNKRKNFALCKITTAQGLEHIQSHFIKGSHWVGLKLHWGVSSRSHLLNKISLSSVMYPYYFTLWRRADLPESP